MHFQHEPLSSPHKIVETVKYGKRHYVTPAGTFPSVTTVLSMGDQTHLKAWRERLGDEEADRISRESANRGTRLHSAVELYLDNNPDYAHQSLITKELFRQIKTPLDDLIQIVHAQESPLFSKAIRSAGRCDCIATIDGTMTMVDFKTSKKEKDPTWIENYKQQVSAYIIMSNELYGTKIKDFCIITANLEENHPTVTFGKAKDHIGDFMVLRAKYDEFVLQSTKNQVK